jgi:hypothetical protein
MRFLTLRRRKGPFLGSALTAWDFGKGSLADLAVSVPTTRPPRLV